MEIDITHMIEDSATIHTLSGSICEFGDNAAGYTWDNSKDYADLNPLLKSPEDIEEARNYFKELGFENYETLSIEDIQALTVQYIAGDIKEFEDYDSYEDYQKASENGQVSGRIFKNEEKYYFYLGN